MIGLDRPTRDEENLNEPPAIRSKTKNQLYALLAEEWYLPSVDSKGVNRKWLVAVYKGEVFRVGLMEMRRFEIELTPLQTKRTGLVNLTYILDKLNQLLKERGLKELGFPRFVVPEENWLVKVARFIDRKNVMEFFGSKLEDNEFPETVSERVHHARDNAYSYVFHGNNLMQNQKVYQAVKEISESYRRIISRKIDKKDLLNSLEQLEERLKEEEAFLKSSLVKASTSIMAVAEQGWDMDQVYMEGENQLAFRDRLLDFKRL